MQQDKTNSTSPKVEPVRHALRTPQLIRRECCMPPVLLSRTMEAPVIIPTITDRDEWNYLKTLKSSDLVGFPNAASQGYYDRVLQYKYPQSQQIILTATTFQVLQSGMYAVPVQLTAEQQARQRLFDALDIPIEGTIPKENWLQLLVDENLLPNPF